MIAPVARKINLGYFLKIDTPLFAKGRKYEFSVDGQMSMCYDIFVRAARKLPSFLQKVLDPNVTS